MSKAPETDNLARGNHVVPTEWAEQLERERNIATDQWQLCIDHAKKLESERDELQKKYDTLAAENMLEVHKLCKERDEWRKCAYGLHSTVMYLMPDLMQQEYGFSGEKKSVLKFEQLAKNCK